jgi:hypothetical protein
MAIDGGQQRGNQKNVSNPDEHNGTLGCPGIKVKLVGTPVVLVIAFNGWVQLYMIPAIRKSGYGESESQKASHDEQKNPAEVVVQTGVCREGNCAATAAPGEN